MKRVHLVLALLCCTAIITVIACKKKKTETVYDPSHLNEYFAGLRTSPQSISVQAGRDTVVSGARGTVLHFYQNSFKDAAGNVITAGTINLQLTEMYTPGDMIANRTSATADGQVLQSGGQVMIVATMNGNPVLANKYGIAFKQPAASSQPMALYYQGGNNADSSVTWKVSDTTKNGTTAAGTNDTSSHTGTKSDTITINTGTHTYHFPGFYYLFDSCTDFRWVNCDIRSVWGPGVNFTNISLVMPDASFKNANTQVYFIFSSINSTVNLYYNPSTKSFVGDDAYPPFPIGKPYKLIAMADKDGTYYYFESSGTVTNGMTINAAMEQKTLADISILLKGL
jgi:hypothetical protein